MTDIPAEHTNKSSTRGKGIMMKYLAALALMTSAMTLQGCSAKDPYEREVPSYKDAEAVNGAITDVKTEDKQILRAYFFTVANMDTGLLETDKSLTGAKTIGEAIAKQKASVAESDRKWEANRKKHRDEMDALEAQMEQDEKDYYNGK